MGSRERLYRGEYDDGVLLGTKREACIRFLEAAAAAAPALLTTLAKIQAPRDDFRPPQGLLLPVSGMMLQYPEFTSAAAKRRLCADVDQWAGSHRVRSPWVMHVAVFTLQGWAYDEHARKACTWMFPEVIGLFPATSLTPILPQPLIEDWESASRRFRTLWDARKAEHQRGGYVVAPQRDPRQFDWLARYLVGREPIADIAKGAKVGWSAVRAALIKAARLLELPLPDVAPARRGVAHRAARIADPGVPSPPRRTGTPRPGRA